ncbi:unnamed protein product [Prorocentrum cordatum]|uniref:Uncharacterized protein n=2 Tax=Prorocentrum cordatum TaxID=2364126 RepID=A0ABN9RE80_9DINO|nr:unnamed protein product [Polarella glacialis]
MTGPVIHMDMGMASSSASPASGAQPAMAQPVGATCHLHGWVASDIDTGVLEVHGAARLRSMGVEIKKLDIFELHREDWLTQVPSLIFMSNLCPPTGHRDYLQWLLKKYLQWNPNASERRMHYEVMCFEAVIAQCPSASVVTIMRSNEARRGGGTPVVEAQMGHVPGYVPKECNHDAGDDLRPLGGGGTNRVRMKLHGPLRPNDFISPNGDGSINVVALCAAATANRMKVLFLGEWDGSLSLGCAVGCMYHQTLDRELGIGMVFDRGIVPRRSLNNQRPSTYKEFYEYAMQYRAVQIVDEAARMNAPWPEDWEDRLNPYVGLNTACMWHFAQVCTDANGLSLVFSAAQSSMGAGPINP